MAYAIRVKRIISDYPINYRVKHHQEAKTLISILMDTLEYTDDTVEITIEHEEDEK